MSDILAPLLQRLREEAQKNRRKQEDFLQRFRWSLGIKERVQETLWTPPASPEVSDSEPIYVTQSKRFSTQLGYSLSYYNENWKWFVVIDGRPLLLQNEMKESSEPETWIWMWSHENYSKENRGPFTYFSHTASIKYAQGQKDLAIPTRQDWREMADSVGWCENLMHILCIEFDGYCSQQHTPHESDNNMMLWCADGYCRFEKNYSRPWNLRCSEYIPQDGYCLRLMKTR